MLRHRNGSSTVTNDAYLRKTKQKYYYISGSYFTIIITKYFGIMYEDCTRFPRPMMEHTFTNEYDIIVCAFSLLLQRFQKEDNWYHSEYNTYTSVYLRDCEVTPLPSWANERTFVSEPDIPALDLNCDSDIEEQSSGRNQLVNPRIDQCNKMNMTRSGRVFENKPNDHTLLELEQRSGKQSKKKRSRTRRRLRAEYKDTWRLTLREITQET